MKNEIIKELYLTVQLLGGKSYILSTIGSIGTTQTDEEILKLIKEYNKYTLNELKEHSESCIKYDQK